LNRVTDVDIVSVRSKRRQRTKRLGLVPRNVAHVARSPDVDPSPAVDRKEAATWTAEEHRLGHATIAVTIDTYSHVTPSMDADAADLVAASIFGVTRR
jgi:hypothetical protein